MKVATMAPLPLLNLTSNDPYMMCLFQECDHKKEYADFFKAQVQRGAHVIMDNGAAEGVNPEISDLYPMYKYVQPTEIILPDVVYDTDETIKRTILSLGYLKAKDSDFVAKTKIMAVPQGETFADWLECMRIFIDLPGVTTIGVSKFVTPKYQEQMGDDANVRLECVGAILDRARLMNKDIEIHLLGCWQNPIEIAEICKAYGDKVRGTDSGIAYVYSRANIEYSPDIDRPDNEEIDFINGTCDSVLFTQNKIRYINTCQGLIE